jgi:hypothetical protein
MFPSELLAESLERTMFDNQKARDGGSRLTRNRKVWVFALTAVLLLSVAVAGMAWLPVQIEIEQVADVSVTPVSSTTVPASTVPPATEPPQVIDLTSSGDPLDGDDDPALCETLPTFLIADAGYQTVAVLFGCGTQDVPELNATVFRTIDVGDDPVEGSLLGLLAGPTSREQGSGVSSFFSTDTAGALESVTLNAGALVVDFNDGIYVNNANTSTGSVFFKAELLANVFQYPEVETVEFQIDGSCELWAGYFESQQCQVVSRADWDTQQASWIAEMSDGK